MLVGPETVLTARHCVDYLATTGDLAFAIGPDAEKPDRLVEVVGVVAAEPSPRPRYPESRLLWQTRDVAIVQLADPITDIEPAVLRKPGENVVGRKFAVVGYGRSGTNYGTEGQRRVGLQTVQATSGPAYQALFEDYDTFKAWYERGGYSTTYLTPSEVPLPPDADGGISPTVVYQSAACADAGPVDMGSYGGAGGGAYGGAGSGAIGGTGSSPMGGTVGSPMGGTGGSPDGGVHDDVCTLPQPAPIPDWEDFYTQRAWKNTILDEGYELIAGGGPGEAKACDGDSGAPLLKYNANTGKYMVYGLVVGGVENNEGGCDQGALYAAFGPEILPFLRKEAKWTDPCGDLDGYGMCQGDTATRCSEATEGLGRQILTFDCGLIGLTCNTGWDGAAQCGDTPCLVIRQHATAVPQ